jgi:tubulin alpha
MIIPIRYNVSTVHASLRRKLIRSENFLSRIVLMTREVVSVHIGQAGCNVGSDVWNIFQQDAMSTTVVNSSPDSSRHDTQNNEGENPFFYEVGSGSSKSRSIFVDTDPSVMDLGGRQKGPDSLDKSIFSSDDLLAFKHDCRSNFFEGRAQSSEYSVSGLTMDRVRRHVERCSNPGGFFVFRSIGGGTGSGVGTCILEELHEEFKKSTIIEPLLYPSEQSSTCSIEAYNSIFSLASSMSLVSLSLMLDNQAAFRICRSERKISNPSFTDMNRLIAEMVSGAASSLRHRSTLNASLDEIVTNIVPEPTFRYALVSVSPIGGNRLVRGRPTREMVMSLLDAKSCLCGGLPGTSRYFAASILCLGGKNLAVIDVQKSLQLMKSADRINTVPWVPNSFKVGVVNTPTVSADQSVMIANSTSVRSLFVRQYKEFLALLYHRSYVWQFLDAGGEMDDFHSARETVRGLIEKYDGIESLCVTETEAAQMRVIRGSMS